MEEFGIATPPQFMGEEHIYKKALLTFASAYKNFGDELESSDVEKAKFLLHKIKSATTLLGLESITSKVVEMENLAMDSNTKPSKDSINALQYLLESEFIKIAKIT